MARWTASCDSFERCCTSTSCVGRLTPRSLQPIDAPTRRASSRIVAVSERVNISIEWTHWPRAADFLVDSGWNLIVIDCSGTKSAARSFDADV
jgi:hypothetical protein